jgi:hypothetical protein
VKSKYWYYKGSDIIDTRKKEKETRALKAKRQAAKAKKRQFALLIQYVNIALNNLKTNNYILCPMIMSFHTQL